MKSYFVNVNVPRLWLEVYAPEDDPHFDRAASAIARWYHFQQQGEKCGCCGLTEEDFDRLHARHWDGAAPEDIPDTPSVRWVLDHCHASGRNRGTICTPCNVSLGKLENGHKCVDRWKPEVLEMFKRYLERGQQEEK